VQTRVLVVYVNTRLHAHIHPRHGPVARSRRVVLALQRAAAVDGDTQSRTRDSARAVVRDGSGGGAGAGRRGARSFSARA
jgi:hypothetical protein